jgi:hypothetical protein
MYLLSTANGGGNVKSDNLSANEVVASSDVGGDLEPHFAAVIVHVLCGPVLGVRVPIGEMSNTVFDRREPRPYGLMRPVALTLNQLADQGVVVARSSTLAM